MSARPGQDVVDAMRRGTGGMLRSSADPDELMDGARVAGWSSAVLDTADGPDKPELMSRLASALSLPDWFGRNWDALADCLTEVGSPPGVLLVWTGSADLVPSLSGVLDDVLRERAEQDRPAPLLVVRTAAPGQPDPAAH